MEDFVVRGKESKDEVQIYTWKDATLRELTNLVISQFDLMCLHSIFFLPLLPFMLMVGSLSVFCKGQRSGSDCKEKKRQTLLRLCIPRQK